MKTPFGGLWAALLTVSLAAPAAAQMAGPAPDPSLFAELRYRMVGPSRGGRVTAVAGHRAHPSTFYMGASGGGVWKTQDNGLNWFNLSDGYLGSPSIGAIRVADSDSDIVYVGTGSDGMRSNVIVGDGVYRSPDAGETWTHVGLEKAGLIGALLIHPTDPDRVFVAAIGNPFGPNPERGVYRTTDGGASWTNVLFVSDSIGVSDLEFAPDDPNTIYATSWRGERKPWTIISGAVEGGVYRSTDGGDTWTLMTQGLPSGLRGKADLAVSAADPDRVYVLIEALADTGGVYRSDDRGQRWRQVSDFQPIRNRPFYYTNLEGHPTDPDVLWGMAEGYYKSTDGGQTWRSEQVPHGDNHDLWINPDNPDIMIQSNDGGANVTLDGGRTWSTQHNQPTAELYQVDVDDSFIYRLYAGQQDNSTISVPSLPPRSSLSGPQGLWEEHGGCETGPAIPKPGDPDIVYASCKGRFGLYNRRTGQEQQYYVGFENLYGTNPANLMYRFQRTVPVHVSPHDPDLVYHGSQFVHRTRDGGRNWETISPDLTAFEPAYQMHSGGPITVDATGEEHYSVVYDIQESVLEAGVIWAGANDGPLHITRDDGATWEDVTPPMPGLGRVQTIEVSPHDPAKAYVAVLRYMLDDWEPWGWKTEDYGQSWTRITTGSNGVPGDEPLRVIREDPDRAGLLYAGTDKGMYVSFDDGGSWQSLQLNLPLTPVTDIKVTRQDLQISTMGRSFWIMDDITPLHELSDRVANSAAHLFEVRDAYRLRGRFGGFGAASEADPEYPSVGAHIDYVIGAGTTGEVSLEILDVAGTVIRTFSSEGAEPTTEDVPTMREYLTVTRGTARMAKEPGMHRFVWDLEHAGPWGLRAQRFGGGGPMVLPGRYQARLSVGAWTETKDFEVRMDPRVLESGVTIADLQEQVELAIETRDALSEARLAVAQIEKARAEGRGGEALEEIRNAMVTGPIRYTRPMLVDQISYLYSNLMSADQAPGGEASMRFEQLDEELQRHIRELERILRANITDQPE